MKKSRIYRNIDWTIIIPIIFWIICIISSFAKLLHTGTKVQITNIIDIINFLNDKWLIIRQAGLITILDIINSNTFSTYVSMVIVLLYQSFTAEKQKDQKIPDKLKSNAIILTIAYCVIFLLNVCWFNLFMTGFVTMFSIIYVWNFF